MPNELQRHWNEFRANPDARTFELVYEATKAMVWTICRRTLLDPEDASDAFQATYASILADARLRRDPFDGAETDAHSIVQRIAGREAGTLRKRRYRRSKRETSMDTAPDRPDARPSAAERASADEMRGKLEALIALLPERFRLPLQLYYFHGMSHEEIGKTLGCPANTVSTWIDRGRKKLKPLAQRAGLAESSMALAALATGATFGDPPAAMAAALVFAKAEAAIASTVAAAAAGATGGAIASSSAAATGGATIAQTLSGVLTMKAKTILISAAVVVLGSAGIITGTYWKSKQPSRASTTVSSTQNSTKPAQAKPAQALSGSSEKSIATDAAAAKPAEAAEQTLTVKVLWASNQQPVAGAIVAARKRPMPEKAPGAPSLSAVEFPDSFDDLVHAETDNKGEASIQLPADWRSATVLARHDSGGDVSAPVNLAESKSSTLNMREEATVFGRIWLETTGRPAAGAMVRLFHPTLGLRKQTTANEAGEYTFRHLAEESVTVAARQGELLAPDGAGADAAILLNPGQKYGPHDLFLKQGAVLTGKVTTKFSDRPIDGASVKIEQRGWTLETTAKPDGAYRLAGMAREETRAAASAEKYARDTQDIDFRAAAELTANFALDEAVEALIHVADPSGTAVAGAQIRISENSANQQFADQSTDDSGTLLIQGLPRSVRFDVSATKEGYERISDTMTALAPDETRKEFNLVLRPTEPKNMVAIAGRVINAAGSPVAGASVGWGSVYGIHMSEMVTTDAEGKFRIDLPDSGEKIELLARAKGYAPGWASEVNPGTPSEPGMAEIVLEDGHWIEVTVVDVAQKPIPNVSISPRYATPENRNRMLYIGSPKVGELLPRTGADGKVRFEDLPGPAVNLIASAKGYTESRQAKFDVDTAVTIELLGTGIFKGRLIDAKTKQPITAFSVSYNRSGANQPTKSDVSSAEGVFELTELGLNQNFSLTIQARGYMQVNRPNLQGKAPEDAAETLIEIAPGRPVRGVVVDATLGSPVAAASLYFSTTTRAPYIAWDDVAMAIGASSGSVQETTSDEKGEFEFYEDATPGTLILEAKNYARTFFTPEKIAELPREGDRIRVAMHPGAQVRGAYFEEGKPKAGIRIELVSPVGVLTANGTTISQEFGARSTSTAGEFVWEGLAAGRYKLSDMTFVGETLLSRYQRSFDLAEGEVKIVNLGDGLGPYKMTGTVFGSDEKPAEAASIALRPQFPSEYARFDAASDLNGKFEFTGLHPGVYRAVIWKGRKGGIPAEEFVLGLTDSTLFRIDEPVEVRSDTVHDFHAGAPSRVVGHLVFPPDMPPAIRSKIRGAQIAATNPTAPPTNGATQAVLNWGNSAIPNDRFEFRGRFSGEFGIALMTDQGVRGVTSLIPLPGTYTIDSAGKTQDLGDIAVPSGGNVALTLSYADKVAVRPDYMQIVCTPADGPGPVASLVARSSAAVQTLGPLTAGNYNVGIYATGFKATPASMVLTIMPAGDAPAVFALEPEGVITGSVNEDRSTGNRLNVIPKTVTVAGNGITRTLQPGAERYTAQGFAARAMAGVDFMLGHTYEFHGLPDGVYDLTIEADGFNTWTSKRTVKAGVIDRSLTYNMLEPK